MAPRPVDCAPLIDIRRMTGASECHACGRCAGYRGAVDLRARRPDAEILGIREQRVSRGEALLLIFGVIGIASAAFLWSTSRRFVLAKTAIAEWLVDQDAYSLLQDNAPWWLLTHHPESGDVFTWLDGFCILVAILGGGALLGLFVFVAIHLAARLSGDPRLTWQRLSMALAPIAGVGLFLGLSMLTLRHLRAEGLAPSWVPGARMGFVGIGMAGSFWLGGRLLLPRLPAFAVYAMPVFAIGGMWLHAFFAR